MAAANIACLLSRRTDVKRGILVVDWDLDAPGLHWFFVTNPAGVGEERFSLAHDGLLELFKSVETQIRALPTQPAFEDAAEQIFRTLDIESFVVPTDIPKVSLLPAGRLGFDYANDISHFDWRALFDSAPSSIRIFAEVLSERYDYVLIDSRTGLNDVSGICTALLPDQLVVVFTPNRQSLIGGIEMARRAVLYRKGSEDVRPLTVYPLPSRVDVSEPGLLEKWRFGDTFRQEDSQGYQKRFEALFASIYTMPSCDLKNYFDEVQIQHLPRYSYGEEIAARHERGTRLSLSRSYATFADILIKGETPWDVPPSQQGGTELVPGAKHSITKLESTKEYLSEDRFRLKLHDLVAGEVRQVTERLSRLPLDGAPTWEGFIERLHSCEHASHDLVLIQALLGYWGNTSHRALQRLGAKQICDQIIAASGLTLYLNVRYYPALLLLYAGGIAAVANQQYGNLFDLMLTPVRIQHSGTDIKPTLIRAVTDAMLELQRMEAFKHLPGLERRYAPKSDYLRDLLQPLLDDLLFLGTGYDAAFDRFELLYALEYCNQYEGDSRLGGRFWAPVGRFGWRKEVLRDLVNEAQDSGSNWAPVQAGLFNGSLDRFKVVGEGLSQLILTLPWY
jgi:hypothetical protein